MRMMDFRRWTSSDVDLDLHACVCACVVLPSCVACALDLGFCACGVTCDSRHACKFCRRARRLGGSPKFDCDGVRLSLATDAYSG